MRDATVAKLDATLATGGATLKTAWLEVIGFNDSSETIQCLRRKLKSEYSASAALDVLLARTSKTAFAHVAETHRTLMVAWK